MCRHISHWDLVHPGLFGSTCPQNNVSQLSWWLSLFIYSPKIPGGSSSIVLQLVEHGEQVKPWVVIAEETGLWKLFLYVHRNYCIFIEIIVLKCLLVWEWVAISSVGDIQDSKSFTNHSGKKNTEGYGPPFFLRLHRFVSMSFTALCLQV